MEENLKKALSEMLVLALLHERDYYALELSGAILERSNGAIEITFPYAILYRMIEQQYIQELPKRIAPDGRRRQYFGITETGKGYFQQIWKVYKTFTSGVNQLVTSVLSVGEGVTANERTLPSNCSQPVRLPIRGKGASVVSTEQCSNHFL